MLHCVHASPVEAPTVTTQLAPLTPARWLTGWSLDVPAVLLAVLVVAVYLLAVRQVRAHAGSWHWAATGWFVGAGAGSLLLVTCSFLGTYSRALFWSLAVQDVLLMTLVPVGLTLGRPVALWRAVRPVRGVAASPARRVLGRLLGFPLTGSVLAITLLLLVYTTGWDQSRLQHSALLELTRLVLLSAGCGFLFPLLGVDEGTGRTSYPVRTVIAFLDGLLDALPGLAVLGSGHVIAADYYTRVARSWGPSLARAQQIGGTAMIALSELVGLPALVVLLTAWVRSDARQASDVDAALDVIDAAEHAARATHHDLAQNDLLQRPWWEIEAGPPDDLARRGWPQAPTQPRQRDVT